MASQRGLWLRLLEPIDVVRARCQSPMEDFNDPLGRLVGSRISVHLTRICLAARVPSNGVSYAMLIAGLAGGVMLGGGGGWAVAGFAALVAYYFLDCVDGELARYRGETNIEMAAFDFLGHIAVKSVTWAGLGLGLLRETGEIWLLILCLAALVATLVQKALHDVPGILFIQKLLAQGSHLDGQVIRTHLRERLEGDSPPPGGSEDAERGAEPGTKRFGLASRMRYLVLNFDVAMFLFLLAALLDVILIPERSIRVLDLFNGGFKGALAAFYGVALPLNLLDHLVTFVKGGKLHREVAGYMARSASLELLDDRRTGESQGPERPGEPQSKAVK